MKNLLLLFVAISIAFVSCKKKTQTNPINPSGTTDSTETVKVVVGSINLPPGIKDTIQLVGAQSIGWSTAQQLQLSISPCALAYPSVYPAIYSFSISKTIATINQPATWPDFSYQIENLNLSINPNDSLYIDLYINGKLVAYAKGAQQYGLFITYNQ